jgi:hypothetical protein
MKEIPALRSAGIVRKRIQSIVPGQSCNADLSHRLCVIRFWLCCLA